MMSSRSEKAEARRAEILDAALSLFAAQGFSATSTRQIAAAAGVAEGLLFHYFPSKVAIMHALADRRHTLAFSILAPAAAPPSSMPDAPAPAPSHPLPPARTLLPLFARQTLAMMRRESDLITLLLAEAQTDPDMGRASLEMMAAVEQQMVDYLQQRRAAGELRSDLPVAVSAQGFFGALMIFFQRNRGLSDEAWDAAVDAFAPQWAAFWYEGARARALISPPAPATPVAP